MAAVNLPPPTNNFRKSSDQKIVKTKQIDLSRSVELPKMRVETCGLTVDLSNRSRHWKERKRRPTRKSSKRSRNPSPSSPRMNRVSLELFDRETDTKADRRTFSVSPSESYEQQANYVKSMKIGKMPSPSFIAMEEFYSDLRSALAPPSQLPRTYPDIDTMHYRPSGRLTRLSSQSVKFRRDRQGQTFGEAKTFQPQSTREITILSHLASNRRSEMEEARNMLSCEPFPGYLSRENSANVSTTQLERMAEVLEDKPSSSTRKTPPRVPPVADFFRQRSSMKPKAVFDQFSSLLPEDALKNGKFQHQTTPDNESDQIQKQNKISRNRKEIMSEKSKDCSNCPLCLMFGSPSKKPVCPPNSPSPK